MASLGSAIVEKRIMSIATFGEVWFGAQDVYMLVLSRRHCFSVGFSGDLLTND